jgi:hypothetical protein
MSGIEFDKEFDKLSKGSQSSTFSARSARMSNQQSSAFPAGISNVKSRESLVMSSDIPEDPFIAAPFSLPGKNAKSIH